VDTHPTKIQAWLLATRPKTLPAAVMPVIIGSAVAIHSEVFHFGAAVAALLCALLIQIGTNFSNDLLDFTAGTDTSERLGPARAVASRWLSEREMLAGTVFTFGLTFPLGLYLIWLAGWPALVIGLLSIAAGIAYTGGPYPLAYNGLGDLFVLIFFGGVATIGTYFVQAQSVSSLSVLASIPAGSLITNILVVNNYRDIESDREAGKHTFAVIIGKAGSRLEYLFFLTISYLTPFILLVFYDFTLWVLLPLFSLPVALSNASMLYSGLSGKPLNVLLEKTARLCLIYGLLFSLGIIL